MKSFRTLQALSVLVVLLAFLTTACRGPLSVSGSGANFGGGTDPSTTTTASPIKNVVVLVFQNRSFDHLFQKYTPPAGQTIEVARPGVLGFTQTDINGANPTSPFLLANPFTTDLAHNHNPYLTAYNSGSMDGFIKADKDFPTPTQVMGYYDSSTPAMPILYSYASQFALADHYFSSVLSSAPAQMKYAVSATDNGQPFSVQPVYGPCQDPDPAATPDTAPNVGDQLSGANIGWTWFHENYGLCTGYVQQQNPFQYFTTTQNTVHLQDYQIFLNQMSANSLPSVSFVQMNPSHSGHPGSSSITAAVNFLDGFVQKAQASPEWKQMAIIVIWDEGGGWYDHVSPPQVDSEGLGIRVPMLVISPFAKKGVVVHDLMDHTSILKFIQWNFGLASLNSRNSNASISNMTSMFTF